MSKSVIIGPMRPHLTAAFWAALWLALAPAAAAHDIPNDVTVRAFLKPEGQRLQLLVRVPMSALRDARRPTRGPGYIDFARVGSSLRTVAKVWLADDLLVYEDDEPLGSPTLVAVRLSLPSDRSFGTYDEALAHLNGPPLPDDTPLSWDQALLDARLEYEIRSERSRFSIRPRLGRLGRQVLTVLQFLPPGGAVRAFELAGDPGVVLLDPRWHQAALRFVQMGFWHILDGIDHLLFLLCLVIPLRRLRPLVLVVTSFTLAHSITLVASAFGVVPQVLWFPPLIETLIAISIVYMALENIVAPRLERRWMITFGFGLVHGFGFSFALRDTLQFAGSHLLTSLLSFNVGVELGQLLVLVVLVPLLHLVFRYVVADRPGTIILSALVAHTGWHWTTERAARLRQFQFEWPAWNLALAAATLRWVMLLVIAAGLVWLVFGVLLRPAAGAKADDA
jgi:hypothetical protein